MAVIGIKLPHTDNKKFQHLYQYSGLEGSALKLQRYAAKVGSVTASVCKRGIHAFKKIAIGTIREVLQSLSSAGFGTSASTRTKHQIW